MVKIYFKAIIVSLALITHTSALANKPFNSKGSSYSESLKVVKVHSINDSQTKDALKEFSLTLNSFVYDTVFDILSFQSNFYTLESQLREIYKGIDPKSPDHLELCQIFQFSSDKLRAMKNAAECLQFYLLENEMTQKLTHKLIQLKVKLWTLLDFEGVPDPSHEGYAKTIFRAANLMTQWGRMFLNFEDVSLGMIFIFKTEYSQTKQLFNSLLMYVP